jgi:hypothetical protein
MQDQASEDDMNERNASRGPNWALLLVIPAAVIVAKSVARHRAMWESGWTPEGASSHGPGHGHGRHRRFGGDMEAGSFRLPPKIEWMLDTWHTRAHEKADAAESTDATTTATSSKTETA